MVQCEITLYIRRENAGRIVVKEVLDVFHSSIYHGGIDVGNDFEQYIIF